MIRLDQGDGPLRFRMAIERRLCVGPPDAQFMFGGAGLGAAIAAMETATGRPVVWATAQYLSFARPDAVLDLEVVVPVTGRYSSQARVIARVEGQEIITVNAALGSRPGDVSMSWPEIPTVPPPGDCPAMTFDWKRRTDDLNSQFDQRIAAGRFGPERNDGIPSPDGCSAMWVRPSDPAEPIDRVMLALMADFVPSGVGHALGASTGGNSLDNTIRFLDVRPTEWVLCSTRIHGVHAGFGHGRMHLFAEDGALLATASQSMIIRRHGPEVG